MSRIGVFAFVSMPKRPGEMHRSIVFFFYDSDHFFFIIIRQTKANDKAVRKSTTPLTIAFGS